jgi:hypothetical protein
MIIHGSFRQLQWHTKLSRCLCSSPILYKRKKATLENSETRLLFQKIHGTAYFVYYLLAAHFLLIHLASFGLAKRVLSLTFFGGMNILHWCRFFHYNSRHDLKNMINAGLQFETDYTERTVPDSSICKMLLKEK